MANTDDPAGRLCPAAPDAVRAGRPADVPAGFCQLAGGWSQYTAPVITPQPGAELVEDWYVFWAIARRLGRTITYNGVRALDMATPPTADELLELVLHGAPHRLDDLKAHPHGVHAPIAQDRVLPPQEGASGWFDPMPDDVAGELAAFLADGNTPGQWLRDGQSFTHLLSSRWMRDLFNSNGRFVATVRERTPFNPAFLNPDDLTAMGLEPGCKVRITSAHGVIEAIVDADPTLRPGVVSLAHGWGAHPDDDAPVELAGSPVNRLIDSDRHYEPVNSMPHMSAIPVNIVRMPG